MKEAGHFKHLRIALADSQASLAVAGGKGASLARLAAAGLPVPDSFHVTTTAYQQFVADNQRQAGILAAIAAADPAQPATLEVAACTIHDLSMRAALPSPIAEAIARAYAGRGDNPALAVRSSATAEDVPDLDLSPISIPWDSVDEEYLRKPRKWNANDIGCFMLFIGPISSIFDYTTYGLML